jgi:hypothetical protein
LDHRHALETQAAERYLLGELPAAEAEEFELHFFECQICAFAVESGHEFIGAAQDYFRQPAIPAATPAAIPPIKASSSGSFSEALAAFFRPAWVVPAFAALLVVIGYQNAVTIPGMARVLNTARSLPAMQLIGASRGEETVVHVPAGSPFVALAADIPPGTPFKEYVCVLSGADGREISRSIAPAPAEGQPISVLVPSAQFQTGRHSLTIYGSTPDGSLSNKISTYPFSVQIN